MAMASSDDTSLVSSPLLMPVEPFVRDIEQEVGDGSQDNRSIPRNPPTGEEGSLDILVVVDTAAVGIGSVVVALGALAISTVLLLQGPQTVVISKSLPSPSRLLFSVPHSLLPTFQPSLQASRQSRAPEYSKSQAL